MQQPHGAERVSSSVGAGEVVLTPRGAGRLRRAGGLVLRADVAVPPSPGRDVVRVRDSRGQLLGSALWAERGPIAARLYARGDRPLDASLLAERIRGADQRRRQLFASDPDRDAYRVVHGEADLLPGLFVDRYADAAVIQTATAAMDAREPLLAEILRAELGVARVVVRDDGSARDLEELPRRRAILLGGPSSIARFHDAGSLMEADLMEDRKTGSFLDQHENHALAAAYARQLRPRGRALDAFTYHGGFALALARAGLVVTACDEDPQAIGRARRNAELSHARVEFLVHNAFDLLRSHEAAGRRFDVVVVDPPALAKRGRHAPAASQQAALRAYKELNLRALRLVEPGGLLVTCSCSGRISVDDFGAMLDDAAADARRVVQILERRGAGRDHPVLCGLSESEYLKCWYLRVISD